MSSDDITYEQLAAIDVVRADALTHLDIEIRDYRDYLNKKAQHLRDEFEVWLDAEIDKLSERLIQQPPDTT